MGLIDATEALLAELQSAESTPESLQRAEQAVWDAVAQCDEPALLDQALALDALDELPISLKSAAFERRLAIGPREPAVLRQFADHLWLHGPERDEQVEALRREAELLERAQE
jgi:hypothetical protein